MASNNLPAGAFLTSIDGRRCTAIPRVVAVSSSSTTIVQEEPATTTINTIIQTTETPVIVTPTAAPVADQEPAPRIIEDQQSTSTTSSSLETIIVNTEPPVIAPPVPVVTSIVQVVQAQEEESPVPVVAPTPSPSPPSPPPAAPVVVESTAPASDDGGLPSFSPIVGSTTLTQEAPPIQTFQSMIQIQISQTNDGIVIASPTGAAGPEQSGSQDSTPGGILPVGAGGAPLTTTLTSPAQPSSGSNNNNGMSNGPAGDSTNSQVSTVPSPNNNAVRSTLAVAGGVIGGVVAISIIAFLIWWWRRQRLRRRRETFLTPLNMANPFNDEKSGGGGGVMTMNEKGGYVIDRGSIGPTPVTTRFKTALGVNFSKIKGHLRNKDSTTPSVNLNRGTSQFIDSASNASVHSRSNSSFDRADPTTKDRFVDWFSRVKANWRTTRTSQIDTLTPMGQPPPALPPTLSNMDDNQLDREAQRLRSQSRHYSSRRSASAHFLSGLGLSFNNINNKDEERSRTSATPAPLNPFADPVNPFADPTTIPPPPPRRSRGQSIATTMMLGRDSLASVVTRNKFRSDPFDLEIPSGYGGGNSNKLSMISSNAGTAGNSSVGGGRDSQVSMLSDIVGVKKPEGVRTRGRAESFTSSKYSSGISLGEDGWSDPGPDVGRLALNGGRRMSGGSGGGGVGKAM